MVISITRIHIRVWEGEINGKRKEKKERKKRKGKERIGGGKKKERNGDRNDMRGELMEKLTQFFKIN